MSLLSGVGRPRDMRDFQLLTGERAHRVVGHLAAQRPLPADRYEATRVLTSIVADVVGALPKETTRRLALFQAVATAAGAYARRFMPGPAWLFVGAEHELGNGRADLVFRHAETGVVVVDELKVGRSRAAAATVAHHQAARYAVAAAAMWPGQFAGVRVVWLAAPTASEWLASGRQQFQSLAATPYWDLSS